MRAPTLGFALALVAQVALLAALPWKREADDSVSQTIWLVAKAGGGRQDVMQGQYVNLTYQISDPARFVDSRLEADDSRSLRAGETTYVVVAETQPGLWTGLRIVKGHPAHLATGQVAIRGEVVDRGLQINAYLRQQADGSWAADSIVTGEMPRMFDREQQDRALAGARVKRTTIAFRNIESYFVPRNERQRFKEDLLGHPQNVRAQVRVGEDGTASLLQVRVQDRTYDF
jgi:uncharacterized membrane-anchored protein